MSNNSSANVIHRFLFERSDIRGEIVTLSSAYQEASSVQNIPGELRALFGQFLAGAAMIGEILKFEGMITLQARGDGIVPIIMAESNHDGAVRGVVDAVPGSQCLTDDTRELKALPELIGKGVLALTLDPEHGQRYQGVVPLDGATLADCLTHYFEQSEQVPTYLTLFADGDQCGGLFLQCLPSSNEETLLKREEQWQTVCQLAATMRSDEFFSTDHETLLYRLFHEQQCRMFEPKQLYFKCSCSRERSLGALRSLGQKELSELIAEAKPVEMDCQFCGTQYQFSAEELATLIEPDHTLH